MCHEEMAVLGGRGEDYHLVISYAEARALVYQEADRQTTLHFDNEAAHTQLRSNQKWSQDSDRFYF